MQTWEITFRLKDGSLRTHNLEASSLISAFDIAADKHVHHISQIVGCTGYAVKTEKTLDTKTMQS
jgi:hypothetical protein